MKIKIEVDENITEEEVIIRCRDINHDIINIKQNIMDVVNEKKTLVCTRDKTEYYLSMDDILFFETDDDKICVHTSDNMYSIKAKLYELEEKLPGTFFRCSKSSIINLKKVYSIEKNISSTSIVSFRGSNKQVFVSRRYYAILKERMSLRIN